MWVVIKINESLKFGIFVIVGVLIIIGGTCIFYNHDFTSYNSGNYVLFHNNTHINLPENINLNNASQGSIENMSDSLLVVFNNTDYGATFFMFDNKTLFNEEIQYGSNQTNLEIINHNSFKVYKNKDVCTCAIVGELNGYPFLYSVTSDSYEKSLDGIDEFYKLNPDIKNYNLN